jgi:hypothetical protein
LGAANNPAMFGVCCQKIRQRRIRRPPTQFLGKPCRLPPDIHVFTGSKQPWVVLPPDTPAF